MMVRRAVRRLKACDILSTPLSVIFLHLRMTRNETSNSYYLLAEVKADGMESCEVFEAL